MEGDGVGIASGPRYRLRLEVVIFIDPPDQQRSRASMKLSYVRRQITDRKADTALRAAIRFGTVEDSHVMQRHLPRPQTHIDRLAWIDLHGDFLSAAQHVAFGERV